MATGPVTSDDVERDRASLRRRSTTLTVARAISYVAYAWVNVSLVILAFAFLLLLFGANPEAPFAQWVYRHATDVMEPFRGIFPRETTPTGSTIDVSILFAMLVYALVGLAVRSLIDWLTYRRDRLERAVHTEQLLVQQARVAGPPTPPVR